MLGGGLLYNLTAPRIWGQSWMSLMFWGLQERHSVWFIAFRNQDCGSLKNLLQPQAEAWFQKMKTEQFQPRVTTYNRHQDGTSKWRLETTIQRTSGWLFQTGFLIFNPRHEIYMILNDESIYFRRVETTGQIKHNGEIMFFLRDTKMVPSDTRSTSFDPVVAKSCTSW